MGICVEIYLCMKLYINNTPQQKLLELCRVDNTPSFLSGSSWKIFACAFIFSRLDYLKLSLFNVPVQTLNRLQKCQNNATSLVVNTRNKDHMKPLLKHHLFLMPVRSRIEYKASVFISQNYCSNNTAPVYPYNS